jgi:hypothetical protein
MAAGRRHWSACTRWRKRAFEFLIHRCKLRRAAVSSEAGLRKPPAGVTGHDPCTANPAMTFSLFRTFGDAFFVEYRGKVLR